MKQFELRDLETGKEYNLAFRNSEGNWVPCTAKVIKEYTVKFVKSNNQMYSALNDNVEYSINDFWHEYRGYDIFGNKFRMIWTFDTMKECIKWCIDNRTDKI